MRLSLRALLLNARNLDRSLEIYQNVFELCPVARGDRVAALMINETTRQQVLVLREAGGPHAVHPGRGNIGPRLLALEAGSPRELDAIEQRLIRRQASQQLPAVRPAGISDAATGHDRDNDR